MPDSCSTLFLLQKAKKSYQKDLENSQRNVDGDTSSAPGDGCVWFYCFIYINNSVHSLVPYHDAWFLYSAVSVLIFDL